MASKSVEEFHRHSRILRKFNHECTPGWWPITQTSYWPSGFSTARELQELADFISKLDPKTPIMFDLEPPLKKLSLFVRGLLGFRKKKSLLEGMIENTNSICTEWPPSFFTKDWIKKTFGLRGLDHLPRIQLMYSSMIPGSFFKSHVRKEILKMTTTRKNIGVGLGVMGYGVFGNEPQLSLDQLRSDLEFCKTHAIDQIFFFRLGGLTEGAARLLCEFITLGPPRLERGTAD